MKRLAAILIAIVAVVGVSIVVWLLFARDQRITSVGNIEVKVRRVHFGKSERFVAGKLWQRVAASVLPASFAKQMNLKVFTATATNDVLFVWLDILSGTNLPNITLAVVDENALKSARIAPWNWIQSFNGVMTVGFQLSNVPRASRHISLRLRAAPRAGLLELPPIPLRNPAFAKFTPSPAESLPQARADKGETFTLLSANTGMDATGSVAMYRGNSWTELVFQIGTNKPAIRGTNFHETGNWSVKSIECVSDTGNRVMERNVGGRIVWQTSMQYAQRNDDGVMNVHGALWPEETWKIRASFERNMFGEWPADSMVTVPEIPFGLGATNSLNIETQLPGMKLRLLQLGVAPSAIVPEPPNRRFAVLNPQSTNSAVPRPLARVPSVLVVQLDRLSTTDARSELRLLKAVDQRGSNVVSRTVVPTRNKKNFEFQISASPTTTSLDLTFGVLQTHTVEYVVRPSVVRSNVAHWPSND